MHRASNTIYRMRVCQKTFSPSDCAALAALPLQAPSASPPAGPTPSLQAPPSTDDVRQCRAPTAIEGPAVTSGSARCSRSGLAKRAPVPSGSRRSRLDDQQERRPDCCSSTKPAVCGGRLDPSVTAPLDETEQLAGRPAAKRRRRPARTASAYTISGVKHQRQPNPPRRARDPQPMTAPGATSARARQSDQRRRGPRARVRTHRSDRYRSDPSRDPPSAAASAHETRRVLLGSRKPGPPGVCPSVADPGKGHLPFPAFSHASESAAEIAHLQASLDGETRTRTGDTTIFSGAVEALEQR
jgi:hypothetical protein